MQRAYRSAVARVTLKALMLDLELAEKKEEPAVISPRVPIRRDCSNKQLGYTEKRMTQHLVQRHISLSEETQSDFKPVASFPEAEEFYLVNKF